MNTISRHCNQHNFTYEAKLIIGDLYTNCPKCQEEYKAQKEKEREEQVERRRLETIKYDNQCFLHRGISKRFIKDYQANKIKSIDLDNQLTSKEIPLKEVLTYKNDESLVMLGSCGIGKSYLAYRMIVEAFNNYCYFKIKSLDSLVNIYRLTEYNPNSFQNIIDFMHDDTGLIVDEIDNAGDIGIKILNHIINYCYDNCIKLVLIGNCDLESFFSMLDNKSKSRIKEFHFLKNFDLRDMR